jgi:hypothetical protein
MKNKMSFIVIMGIGFVLFLGFICLTSNRSSTSTRVRATSRPTMYLVEYRVEGSGTKASLTYENDQGGTEQRDVRLPWSQEYVAVPPGQFLYIAAQADGNATITCKILLNGIEWRKSTSSGQYVIASCDGLAGLK